jgi:DNA-3-methyladenine glycosylase I
MKRCAWLTDNEIYRRYHDEEWGVPVYDDRLLFEMLNLEGAQAGLSWLTVLLKRENYKQLFANFEVKILKDFTDEYLEEILLNPGIIRNRLKVYGVRKNAIAYTQVVKEWGSFSKYIWHFVDGKPRVNHYKTMKEIPVQENISEAMSKDLKKRGFTFVGPTICYAFMQAVGMVNDHTTDCFRHQYLV